MNISNSFLEIEQIEIRKTIIDLSYFDCLINIVDDEKKDKYILKLLSTIFKGYDKLNLNCKSKKYLNYCNQIFNNIYTVRGRKIKDEIKEKTHKLFEELHNIVNSHFKTSNLDQIVTFELYSCNDNLNKKNFELVNGLLNETFIKKNGGKKN